MPVYKDHPRLRGEYAAYLIGEIPDAGSSPLTRGIFFESLTYEGVEGVIPAYAGNIKFFRDYFGEA